jgi:SAM-dependent methyltransferase
MEAVRQAFEHLAPSFDALGSRNPIGAWVRQANLKRIRETFPPGTTLLELGCGTGRETVALAREGRSILALDISEGMVAAARAKLKAEGLEDRVVVARGSLADLPDIMNASPWRTLDGAYANFSLLYDEPLRPIAEVVHRVLRPGSFFLFTLGNRVILSEALLYGLRLRWSRIIRNLNQPRLHEIHGHVVRIREYSPWQVKMALRGLFELRDLVGLPVFLPPVYLYAAYQRLRGGQRLLMGLDGWLAGKYPWNHLGEATLYKFQRSGT